MNSPWPMFSHDVRHTGRSEIAVNGNSAREKWKVWLTDDARIMSSPAIDKDGTIYIGGQWSDESLHAINADGSIKWHFETNGAVESSPALAKDGTIYVGSDDHKLYAVNPNGTERWRFNAGDFVFSSPAIDSDGTIYIGTTGITMKGFFMHCIPMEQ